MIYREQSPATCREQFSAGRRPRDTGPRRCGPVFAVDSGDAFERLSFGFLVQKRWPGRRSPPSDDGSNLPSLRSRHVRDAVDASDFSPGPFGRGGRDSDDNLQQNRIYPVF